MFHSTTDNHRLVVSIQEEKEESSDVNGVEIVNCDTESSNSLPSNCKTALIALRTTGDPNCLIKTLEALQPKYVVMFDLDIAYIRQLEVGLFSYHC